MVLGVGTEQRRWPSPFGEGDRLGMLNHIDDAKRLAPRRVHRRDLDTVALAADGVRRFALVLTHPKLRGASGAWTSPIALV